MTNYYNNIYTKLIKHTHTHTSLKYGIIGGIISNPLLYLIGLINPIGFAGLLTTGLITKSIISVSGFGLGWNLNYRQDMYQYIYNDNFWIILSRSIKLTDKITFNPDTITDVLQNDNLQIGLLYQLCIYIFIERFSGKSDTDEINLEIQQIIYILLVNHPMYSVFNSKTIKYEIEQLLYSHLYPYINCIYILNHSQIYNNNNDFYIVNNNLLPIKKYINQISEEFRQIINITHPYEKSQFVVNLFKQLAERLQKENIILNADLLLEIVPQIILNNKDIIPKAQIQMMYDYLQDSFDEHGYMATMLISSEKQITQ